MYYRKRQNLPGIVYYKKSINSFLGGIHTEIDETLLPHRYAKMSYNFSHKNGVLENGNGFENLVLYKPSGTPVTMSFPSAVTEVNSLWFYPYYAEVGTTNPHYENMILASTNDGIYFSGVRAVTSAFVKLENTNFTQNPVGIPFVINNNNVMLFTSAADSMRKLDASTAAPINVYENAPKLFTLCRHYERVFGASEGRRNRVWFSSNLDPTNWNATQFEGGYIDLTDERGPIVKVISFGDYVYVFREHGITRISAYGDQSEFTVSNIFLTTSKIDGGSVCVCGEIVFFMAHDGIYSFNGSSVVKQSENLNKMFEGMGAVQQTSSAYFNGKYYLALRLNYLDTTTDDGVNNTLLEKDLQTGEVNLTRGVDISSLCTVEGEGFYNLLCSFNGENKLKIGVLTKNGKVFTQILPKIWKSSFTNLGENSKQKVLKEINIVTYHPCNLIFKTESFEKAVALQGKNFPQRISMNLPFKMLEIQFKSSAEEVKICPPNIVYTVVT